MLMKRRLKKPRKIGSFSFHEVKHMLAREHPSMERVNKYLIQELKGKKRRFVIQLLHRRYNELRYQQEKKEYGIEGVRA